jgi:cobalt/nickel transport system permease protein
MLFAVHISDGVLQTPWLVAGFGGAAVLLLVSMIRIRDEETPRIALLTAAFFVVSLIHVRVGPTSVHLLMNGLVGVILGWRAPLALACGLLLQCWLVQHGGITTLGVNTVVLSLPALAASLLFRLLHRPVFLGRAKPLLVFVSSFAGILSAVFAVGLLVENTRFELETFTAEDALAWTLHPAVLLGAMTLSVLAAALERRLGGAPEFALGMLLGELTVLATVGLNCAVLLLAGERFGPVTPLLLVVLHLPIAVVEGSIVGFTLGFLKKVKPEMLGVCAKQWDVRC